MALLAEEPPSLVDGDKTPLLVRQEESISPRLVNTTFSRSLWAALAYVAFGISLFFASGLSFVPLWMLNQSGNLPGTTSACWRVLFPLQSVLSPETIEAAVDSRDSAGVADLTTLPFFAEAAPFFLVSVTLEVVLCAAVLKRKYYRFNDAFSSLSAGLLSQVGGAAFGMSMTPAYMWIWDHWSVTDVHATSAWSWYVGFLLVDFGYYWFHRASHVLGWMWASHSVHHSSEEYNLTTALRQNLVSGIFGYVVYLPCAFFVPLSLASAHLTFNLLWQFYLHTRLIRRLGPLEYVFNTPSHHRVHHARNPRAIDKNFAAIFIIWDRLFGSFQDENDVLGPQSLVFGVIPPLNSFSPLWANFIGWKDILDKMLSTPGTCNKLSMVLYGPGWRYSKLEQRCKQTSVPAIGHRLNPAEVYDPALPSMWLVIYACCHFLGAAGLYFYYADDWQNLSVSAVGAVLVGFTLHVLNGFIDSDPWAPYLEVLRCALLVVGIIGYATYKPTFLDSIVSAVLLAVALAVHVGGVALFLLVLIKSPFVRSAAATKLQDVAISLRSYGKSAFTRQAPRHSNNVNQPGAIDVDTASHVTCIHT